MCAQCARYVKRILRTDLRKLRTSRFAGLTGKATFGPIGRQV
jgi:hypothetical protein